MSDYNLLNPPPNLLKNMKLKLKIGLSEYTKGATGPDRAGLFARVAPSIITGKFGGGSLFSKISLALA
ncbi:MAG: hypothetical protein AAB355_01365 [Patescibacteria group bacterium]